MTRRKNRVVCPWCGAEKRRGWFSEFERLTAYQHPSEYVDSNCDECGKRFRTTAEECVYYNTRKVGE